MIWIFSYFWILFSDPHPFLSLLYLREFPLMLLKLRAFLLPPLWNFSRVLKSNLLSQSSNSWYFAIWLLLRLFWSSFTEGQHGFCHQKPFFLSAHLPCAHTSLPPVFLMCLFQVLLLSLYGFCSLFLKSFSTPQFHGARAFSLQFPVLVDPF